MLSSCFSVTENDLLELLKFEPKKVRDYVNLTLYKFFFTFLVKSHS